MCNCGMKAATKVQSNPGQMVTVYELRYPNGDKEQFQTLKEATEARNIKGGRLRPFNIAK